MAAPSHLIAFDDAPFERAWRGDVPVIGVACAGLRVEGILRTAVRRDGANATEVLRRAVERSRFAAHTRVILLQGITLAGFNVVDIWKLHEELRMGVLVVARRQPNLRAVESALRNHFPGGLRKWALVRKAGPMERSLDVWIQRAGVSPADADDVLRSLIVNGRIPEPLRLAHLIAGGLTTGHSRGRA